MSASFDLIAPHVLAAWRAAVSRREPRALELAYALELSLPPDPESGSSSTTPATAAPVPPPELAPEVLALLETASTRYAAFRTGTFALLDLGNPHLFAFERTSLGEHLVVINNLAPVPQPVKFGRYSGLRGWDILNRVEFTFPPRAQLESYEFLWLYLE